MESFHGLWEVKFVGRKVPFPHALYGLDARQTHNKRVSIVFLMSIRAIIISLSLQKTKKNNIHLLLCYFCIQKDIVWVM